MATRLTESEWLETVIIPSMGLKDQPDCRNNPEYKGSCHCGFLVYTVQFDLQNPGPLFNTILMRCNCTVCVKTGLLSIAASPTSSFKLLSPPGGYDELKSYGYPEHKNVRRWFCPHCGVHAFLEGTITYQGYILDWCKVNVTSLDERTDGKEMEELKDLNVKYYQGRDQSKEGVKDEPWTGGIW